MRTIVLSGGSGQSLWPLSNDVRSKQFLRLLPSPAGGNESMIQRVIRQCRALTSEDITIATSNSQIDPIRLQLGADVEIVAEPERRGTLPAIALACAYLAGNGAADDEPIVVVPCDVYADDSYFSMLKEMADSVTDDSILVMGIVPKSAETRYGYLNKVGDGYRLTPHPDADVAHKLVDSGALWNAGVFVFTLKQMRNIVKSLGLSFDYVTIKKHYGELPALSFDRYLSRTEMPLQVMQYHGSWKDLGTWEALSAHIPTPVSGNVTVSEDVKHTHILNELDLPIVCVGVDNLIVSASPDGILIADKSASDAVKKHARIIHARPMYEERRWGWYRVMGHTQYPDGQRTLTKLLHLNPDAGISYQRHTYRDEIWTFVDGEAWLVIDDVKIKVGRGYVANIKKGQKHAVKAITPVEIIEVQTGTPLVEEDIERFPYDWES